MERKLVMCIQLRVRLFSTLPISVEKRVSVWGRDTEKVECEYKSNIALYWTYAKKSNVEKLEVTKVRNNLATTKQKKKTEDLVNKYRYIWNTEYMCV